MTTSLYKGEILIIDDELPLSISIQELLQLEGYNAEYVLSVPEGLSFLEENPEIDIILLDIHFAAGQSGIEVLPVLKGKFPYIQIIMLTSESSVTVGVQCMKMGAFDYITKPLDETIFFEKIAGALEKRNLNKLKDLYFRIIVHDFKKPLQGISMAVESLILKGNKRLTEGEARFLSVAQYGCWQLNTMISNILNVERIEDDGVPLRTEAFILNKEIHTHLKILFDTIELYEKAYEYIPLPDPGYVLKTDKELFFRIFANILDNANAHTPAGGKIIIHVKEAENNYLHVSIINQGSYIEKELREKIFHKFYKARYSNKGGTSNFGLGLTFCRLALEILDGRIWVDSHKERNETEFHFTIKNKIGHP